MIVRDVVKAEVWNLSSWTGLRVKSRSDTKRKDGGDGMKETIWKGLRVLD